MKKKTLQTTKLYIKQNFSFVTKLHYGRFKKFILVDKTFMPSIKNLLTLNCLVQNRPEKWLIS